MIVQTHDFTYFTSLQLLITYCSTSHFIVQQFFSKMLVSNATIFQMICENNKAILWMALET